MTSTRRILTFLLFAAVPPAVAQQALRKAIKSASDLPAFSYPVTGNHVDLFGSEEAFRPIAEKMRQDFGSAKAAMRQLAGWLDNPVPLN